MNSIIIQNATLSNVHISKFSPLTYSPYIWLSAKDRSTLSIDSGNRVSQWRDKSGNGFHMNQVVLLDQPVFDPTGLNNRPCITFVGANTTYLNRNMAGTPISNPGLSGALSYIAVFNNSLNPGTRLMIDSGYGTNLTGFTISLLSTAERSVLTTATGSWTSPGNQWAQNVDTVLTCIWNGTTLDIWNNGSFKQSTTSVGNAGTDSRTNFNIGTGSIPSLYADFVLSEFIAYPFELSTIQRLNLDAYFFREWGI